MTKLCKGSDPRQTLGPACETGCALNPLAAELESENDGCRTKIFLSVLSQFQFG
jgi:hypothetical protein